MARSQKHRVASVDRSQPYRNSKQPPDADYSLFDFDVEASRVQSLDQFARVEITPDFALSNRAAERKLASGHDLLTNL